ncbi:MAG: PIN domain-containing protein [Proteobacteria bacterium]|nr:PIN domain-containing protein [Pseudomonadota bacterium]NIS70527.1 PIN domain-containing protein [Pseudomonadota bacterium]
MEAVLDASAALKWQFEDEEATDAATILLNDFVEGKIDLIAPTLFPYEIVSAVNVAVNRKRIREEAAYRAINYITSLGIEVMSFDDLIEPTFRMARQYGLSPYDCAYLALAEKEKCDFFTGDKRLFNAVKRRLAWIKWIGNYPGNVSP